MVLANPDDWQSKGAEKADAAASSSGAPALPALSFMSPLPEAVSGWEWQRAAWEVPVRAGSRITGLGVALPLCYDGRGSSGGVGVAGILGQVAFDMRPRAT